MFKSFSVQFNCNTENTSSCFAGIVPSGLYAPQICDPPRVCTSCYNGNWT